MMSSARVERSACYKMSIHCFLEGTQIVLLHRIFLAEPLEELNMSSITAGVSAGDFQTFLVYAGGLFANSGS